VLRAFAGHGLLGGDGDGVVIVRVIVVVVRATRILPSLAESERWPTLRLSLSPLRPSLA
jgi:hypothetical protein